MSWLDEIRSVMKNPLKRLNMCLWGNIYSDWLQADRILANDLLLVKLSPPTPYIHTHTHTQPHTHTHTNTHTHTQTHTHTHNFCRCLWQTGVCQPAVVWVMTLKSQCYTSDKCVTSCHFMLSPTFSVH